MDRLMFLDLAKDWGIALALAGGCMAVWQGFAPSPVDEGRAPDITLPSTDGSTWDLRDQTAPAYVVNFWATWCGPCKAEIPQFAAYAAAHPEVSVVGVSVDEALPTSRLAVESRRLGITYPVVHDRRGEVAAAWGVTVYPTTFVLDRNHNIVEMRVGVVNSTALEEMVPRTR